MSLGDADRDITHRRHQPPRKIPFFFSLSERQLRLVDAEAKRLDITAQEWLRRKLDAWLEEKPRS